MVIKVLIPTWFLIINNISRAHRTFDISILTKECVTVIFPIQLNNFISYTY